MATKVVKPLQKELSSSIPVADIGEALGLPILVQIKQVQDLKRVLVVCSRMGVFKVLLHCL